ncbi:hypothetical protein [uncultured Shimia sp.]|uniref:hypothetical protein n=1 Tax=uncultured Shimia sp. TaxID=573152 RepID=UPI0026207F74|nr:hypothetical protein [uncultured Shimia sp.]
MIEKQYQFSRCTSPVTGSVAGLFAGLAMKNYGKIASISASNSGIVAFFTTLKHVREDGGGKLPVCHTTCVGVENDK